VDNSNNRDEIPYGYGIDKVSHSNSNFNSNTVVPTVRAATAGSKIPEGFREVDALYAEVIPLVNEKFHDWYCKVFHRLGREKVLQLAAEAKADGIRGDPKRLFSALLTKATGMQQSTASTVDELFGPKYAKGR
jgi:hypothetical protein